MVIRHFHSIWRGIPPYYPPKVNIFCNENSLKNFNNNKKRSLLFCSDWPQNHIYILASTPPMLGLQVCAMRPTIYQHQFSIMNCSPFKNFKCEYIAFWSNPPWFSHSSLSLFLLPFHSPNFLCTLFVDSCWISLV